MTYANIRLLYDLYAYNYYQTKANLCRNGNDLNTRPMYVFTSCQPAMHPSMHSTNLVLKNRLLAMTLYLRHIILLSIFVECQRNNLTKIIY